MNKRSCSKVKTADLINDAVKRLSEAGADTPKLDAEVLLAHALGLRRADLIMLSCEDVNDDSRERFEDLIQRREKREPVSQLTGVREFWSLPILVTPDVLTPRPETEGIVERAKALFDSDAGIDILDLCTGSGCIAAALASEFPHARITATDISASAIDVARKNLAFAAGRITLLHGNLFKALTNSCHSEGAIATEESLALKKQKARDPSPSAQDDKQSNLFDLIVSNPPYIPEGEMASLPPEVRDYEPSRALAAGHDGLAFLRQIANYSSNYLKPGGWLVLEIGSGQAAAVGKALEGAGAYKSITVEKDLAGIERVVSARRSWKNSS
jgi:release factor glutamine methyltransferase